MIAALALGGAFGLAVLVTWRAARPAPEPLPTALRRLHPGATAATRQVPDSWLQRLAIELGAPGAIGSGVRRDLRMIGRSPTQHATAKVLVAVVAGLLPLVWTALVTAAGVAVPLGWLPVIAVALAAGGFVVPDLLVHSEAAQRRRDFTTALGSYLDLVVISLAGGAGVESALRDAARLGDGLAFTRLREALEHAQLAGTSLWVALAQLGDDLGVTALDELAASASLAGTEGAKVRASLAAKAASLRSRQLADAEAAAQAATEQMAVPTVLLLAGFVILVGYPAIHAILTGL